MQPHEERVIKENEELNIKIDKLRGFLRAANRPTLELEDLWLLECQLRTMEIYAMLLAKRIARFKSV